MTYYTFKENLLYDKTHLRDDYKLVFNNLGVYFILEYVCKAHFAFVFAPSFALCPYSNSTNKL